jgi:hypothetical protein
MYKGLIPTLVAWMERKDEQEVVWKRILPKISETEICPILMCADDNDFSCTIIVAEISNCDRFIKWNKLGLDKTHEWETEKIGSNVEWFDKIGELKFETSSYIKMLDNFKKRLVFDKQRL